MAIVTFNRKDLESLIGKKLSDSDYKDKIIMLGVPLERLTEQEVDYEIFPNRPDLLSVEGFARAVAGFFGIKTGLPQYEVKRSNFVVNIDKRLLGLRGCVGCAVVKGVKFTDESIAAFMQLQDKLATTIGRKRKKVGLGTYDLDELRFPISYTVAPKMLQFKPLGMDKEMQLDQVVAEHPKGKEFRHLLQNWIEYPIYMDAKKRIMGLVPLTGAEFAKITPKTRNMFIEVTGTEWKAVMEILNIIVTALADRGAQIYEITSAYPQKKVRLPDLRPRRMKIDINYANELLDLDLKQNEVKEALMKMRFGFIGNDALIPAYRTDIMHQIDLVEEIAISHGYEKFEPRIPKIPTIAKPNENEEHANALRSIMIGLGMQEAVTFVLTNENDEFAKAGKQATERVEIKNPKTADYTMARVSLLPSLLKVFSQNQSSEMPHRIFEIGNAVHIRSGAETGAANVLKLAAGISHSEANYSEMKSILEALFRNLGKKFEISEIKDETFIEGRAAEILINGEKAGIIGEVHPEVLNNFKIEYPVVLFELDAEKLK